MKLPTTSKNVALRSVGAEYDRRPYGERNPSVFLASRYDHTSSNEAYKNGCSFCPKHPIRVGIQAMRAVKHQWELLPNFELGWRRRPELGGLRLLGCCAAHLEVPLLEKSNPCAMRKLVCAHKVNNTLLIMGVINCETGLS